MWDGFNEHKNELEAGTRQRREAPDVATARPTAGSASSS